MQHVWVIPAVMAAGFAIGFAICTRLIQDRSQRRAAVAALGYLDLAAGLFCLDVIIFEQSWAVPIYIVCFVVVPIAVFYVVHALGEPKEAIKKQTVNSLSYSARGQSQQAADEPKHAAVRTLPNAARTAELETSKTERINEVLQASGIVGKDEGALEPGEMKVILEERVAGLKKRIDERNVLPIESDPSLYGQTIEEVYEHGDDIELDEPICDADDDKVYYEKFLTVLQDSPDDTHADEQKALYNKAKILKAKGAPIIASALFKECAEKASDAGLRTEAAQGELACYIEIGDGWSALRCAAELETSEVLSHGERKKLKAMMPVLEAMASS